MADSFGWGDAWKRNLEAGGRYSVEEVVVNCAPLQKAWAREHGVDWSPDQWGLDILRAQLLHFHPDVFFAHDFNTITSAFRVAVRRQAPSIRLVVGWDGIAVNDPGRFSGCDLMLSCNPSTTEVYRGGGFRSETMKLGFNNGVLAHLTRECPAIDASFIGGIMLGAIGHKQRIRALANVARRVPLVLHLSMEPPRRLLRNLLGEALRGRPWVESAKLWRDYAALWSANRGPLFGLRMYSALAASRVGLNVHIDSAGDTAGNMRLFEVTGVGSCLLTDAKANLSDLFVPGQEVMVYESVDDCIAKLEWLLGHEAERAAIARAGQRRTLRDHSLSAEILKAGQLIAESIG
jgi:hypothetical protein